MIWKNDIVIFCSSTRLHNKGRQGLSSCYCPPLLTHYCPLSSPLLLSVPLNPFEVRLFNLDCEATLQVSSLPRIVVTLNDTLQSVDVSVTRRIVSPALSHPADSMELKCYTCNQRLSGFLIGVTIAEEISGPVWLLCVDLFSMSIWV